VYKWILYTIFISSKNENLLRGQTVTWQFSASNWLRGIRNSGILSLASAAHEESMCQTAGLAIIIEQIVSGQSCENNATAVGCIGCIGCIGGAAGAVYPLWPSLTWKTLVEMEGDGQGKRKAHGGH